MLSEIKTRLILEAPPDLTVLNSIVERIGGYREVIYEVEPAPSIPTIFEVSQTLERPVDELDDDQIKIPPQQSERCRCLEGSKGSLRLSGGAFDSPRDLHLRLPYDVVLDWIRGGESAEERKAESK